MAEASAVGGQKSRRLILAVLFAVLVFISKTFLPTPLDKVLVVFQALFLALGSITLGPLGATLVSTIGGLLTSVWRAPFALFTLGFAVLYGILVDGFLMLFKAKTQDGTVQVTRLAAGVTVATAMTGIASYYTTVHVLSILPRNIVLEVSILVIGVLNGLAGGYVASLLWNKALQHVLS
jgi:uncharacterized membrane protein